MGIEIGNSLVLEQVADRAIGLARAREPRGLQHAVGAKGAQRERSALEHRRQFVAIARDRKAGVQGHSVSVRVVPGGGRLVKNKNLKYNIQNKSLLYRIHKSPPPPQ